MAQLHCLLQLLIVYWFFSLTAKAANGEFRFLSYIPQFNRVEHGGSFSFDCSTNDKDATTSLWMKGNAIPWKQRLPKPGKLEKKGNVFTLLNADGHDFFPYKCKAVNRAGREIWTKRLIYIFPKPEEKPRYTYWPEQAQYRHIGHKIFFYLNSTIKMNITWHLHGKNNSFLPIRAKHHVAEIPINKDKGISSKLTLYNLKVNDTGSYSAVAWYRGGKKIEHYTLLVFGPSKPRIYDISPNDTIDELSRKKLGCNVSAYPPADITWYKDGKPVPVCRHKCNKRAPYTYTVDSKSNWTVAFLTIAKVFYEDSGAYLCRANNSEGIAYSHTKLHVRTKPVIRKGNDIRNYRFGKIARVECEVERSYPDPIFEWFYQVSQCEDDSYCNPRPGDNWKPLPGEIGVNPQKTQPGRKSRIILPGNTPREPTFYKCVASNLRGSDSFIYEVLRYRQDSKLEILKVLQEKSVVINADDSLMLQCFLRKGILNHRNLAWYKDGRKLDVSNSTKMSILRVDLNTSKLLGDVDQREIILKIKNATTTDSGLYACRASNDVNETIKVTVKGINPPKLFWRGKAAKGITIYESKTKSLIMQCKLKTGNPKPDFLWFKDNEPLHPNKNQLRKPSCQHAKDGFYYFTPESKQDVILCGDPLRFEKFSGRYTCRAKNKLGEDEIHTDIKIFAAAEIKEPKEKDSQMFVSLGDTVERVCQARGNPLPVVEWRKVQGTTSVLVNGKSKSKYGNATLFIKSFTEEDLGNYSCVARNSHSVQQSSLQLKLDPAAFAITKPESPTSLIGPLLGAIFPTIAIVLAVYCLLQRRRQKVDKYRIGGQRHYDIDPDRTILEQVNDMPYDPDWEFREDRLLLGDVLGSGAFGQVVKAEAMGILSFSARDKTDLAFKRRTKLRRSIKTKQLQQRSDSWKFAKTTVAVKMLKENAGENEYRDLASEIKIMIHIGEHPNIINILGACTRSKRLMLIMEYAPHGSLLKFLRERRPVYQPNWQKTINDPNEEFTLVDLLMTAYQIARGMEFLASKKCIHRDLAARNVLIGEGYVMKIADFGLARDVYKNDEYVKQTTGLLPVKWMALESLFDRVYTEKSDVWSFGIVLWEIFTLGGTPYPGLPTEHLLDFLSENKRMAQPHDCPPKVYNIMRDCWIMQPECRPTFALLAEQLGKFLEKNIRKDNPYISLALEETPTGNHYYLCPKEGTNTARRPSQPLAQDIPGPSGCNSTDIEKKEKYFSDCSIITSNYPASDAMDTISVATSHLGPDPPPSYDEALRRSTDALESVTQSILEEEKKMKAAAAWVAGYTSNSADEGIGLEDETIERKRLLSSPPNPNQASRNNNCEELGILVHPTPPANGGRKHRIESVV